MKIFSKNKEDKKEKVKKEKPKKEHPKLVAFKYKTLKFYSKRIKYYPFMLLIIAVLLDLFVETMARHSLIQGAIFLVAHPLVAVCNIVLIFAVISLSMLFTKRIFATGMFSLIWVALGIVNGVILSNRMTPFNVKDLSNISEARSILTNYFSVKGLILIGIGVLIVLALIVFLYRKTPRKKSHIGFKRTLAVVILIIAGAFGIITGSMKVGVLDTYFANLAYAYRDNGMPYSFMITWIKTGIDKPKNYSEDMVKDIFKHGELGDDGIYSPKDDEAHKAKNTPNVIYLQLESFIDPTMVMGLEFNKDPAPNFRKLMKEYSSGYLTVPAIGAGTANVEFEVMTGISARFFGPGEYPYKSILTEQTCEAAPYDMKQLGYSAHAIHNHRGAFYNRNTVFANIGFDTFTCLEYMSNVMKTPKNWAKDSLLTDNILDALNSTENPDYIYTISVQGHGKYPTEEVLTDPAIKLTADGMDEESRWAYEYYVNQVYEMDIFIKELTAALDDYNEDVILIMYGDHLPALDMSEDMVKSGDLYKTQYVIWDNIGLTKKDEDLHAYNLHAAVMDKLGLSAGLLTKYHQNYKDTKGYLKNLKTLSYDMLYGDQYIYGQKNPFKPTDLKMGVKDIKIKEIVEINGKYYIKGQNFNEFSKISLNGEILKTVYIGPSILGLNEEVDPKDVSKMKVSQVEKNKEILSTTE